MKYRTIYLDPPWPERGGGKIKRGADRHYPLMSIQEIYDYITNFEQDLDDNCHMYLWATNNYLPAAFDLMRDAGFKYKTCITWFKDRIGLGQYFRGVTEHCLFGVKGNLPYKIINGMRQQGITGFAANRTKHSEKPELMREMIEKVSYGPYLEVFARKKSSGWHVIGNEVQ